jgi:hypothetical protein
MKMKTIGYHFVGLKLRDDRETPPDGVWLEHEGELVMCKSGLHFSENAFDALAYAPGTILCLVEVEDFTTDGDKGVARRRKILQRVDITEQLKSFARWCALRVVHLWDAPEVVVQFLKTGDESLREATGAAVYAVAYAAGREAAYAACAANAAGREAEKEAQRAEFKRLCAIALG